MSKKATKDKKAKKVKKAAKSASLAEQTRLRAEVTVLRLLVDRMLLVQARNLGKEAYLEDLHKNLMVDLDRVDEAGMREVMNTEIERSLEVVRTQLLLARADSSKRN